MPLYFYHKAGTASIALSGLSASPILSFNSVRLDEPNKTIQMLTSKDTIAALLDSSSLLSNILGEYPMNFLIRAHESVFKSAGLWMSIEAG